MGTILDGVAIKVISGIILAILGIGVTKKVIYVQGERSSGTIWKILILVGYILMYGSLLYTFSWAITEGFKEKVAIGISVLVLSFIMIILGRLVLWFKR